MRFRMAEFEHRKIHDLPLNLIKIRLYRARCVLSFFFFQNNKNARLEIEDMQLNFIRWTKQALLEKTKNN